MCCSTMWAAMLAASLVVSIWAMPQEDKPEADIRQVEKTDKRDLAAATILQMLDDFTKQLTKAKAGQGGAAPSGSGSELQGTNSQDVNPSYMREHDSSLGSAKNFRM